MKSRLFSDTRELDAPFLPRDEVCVCLRLKRRAYEQALNRACQLQVSSGEYIARLILADAVSNAGTEAPCRPDTPWSRFPPAPPGH